MTSIVPVPNCNNKLTLFFFRYPETPKSTLSEDDPIERPETVFQNCDREQFLLNLGNSKFCLVIVDCCGPLSPSGPRAT